jgi:hypothetical protein
MWVGAYETAMATTGEPRTWEEWGAVYGAQPAVYWTDNLASKAANRKGEQGFKVHCQECGKVCTKARGGEVLTRATVVCGRCYDESKHGSCSTATNYCRA